MCIAKIANLSGLSVRDENKVKLDVINSTSKSKKKTLKSSVDKTNTVKWKIDHGVIPTLSKDKKFITYGMYPQTIVNDDNLINILNTLTESNKLGYYFYDNEYYVKYKRPLFSPDGLEIKGFVQSWYKVDPIVWKVLECENGVYFVISEHLLAYRRFNSLIGYKREPRLRKDYQGNKAVVFDNNYKYSELRSWLNTEFFKSAFFLDDDFIEISSVDNSAISSLYGSNKYACEDTQDKLFLPSAKELTTAWEFYTFENSKDRDCKFTDFAKANKGYGGANYWLRSPICCNPSGVKSVLCGDFCPENLLDVELKRNHGVRVCSRISIRK